MSKYSQGGVIPGGFTVQLVPVPDDKPDQMGWSEGIYCPRCAAVVPAVLWSAGHHCDQPWTTERITEFRASIPDELLRQWDTMKRNALHCPTCLGGAGFIGVRYWCVACRGGNVPVPSGED